MASNRLLLASVLELHHSYEKRSKLPANLCDGFLYQTNSLFRNVRDAVELWGAEYTQEDFCHYTMFFRGALAELLEKKRFIYGDNVTPLVALEAKHPRRFEFDELEVRSNFVFHESTHLIADMILNRSLFQKVKHRDPEQKEALRIQFGEAIGSTHDFLGTLFNQDHLSREIYGFTTNYRSLPWQGAILEPLLETLDFPGLYKFTAMSFLYSYFLYKQIQSEDLQRIVALLFPPRQFNARHFRHLKALMGYALQVDPVARLKHANFYFRLLFDQERSIGDLMDFDFIGVVERNPAVLTALDVLADIAMRGAQSKHFNAGQTGDLEASSNRPRPLTAA